MSELADSAARLHRISPSFWMPPQMSELWENPEKKIFGEGGGMNWAGIWDRESAYSPGDVVRFKGKAYVCIEPVAAFPFALGPGPSGSWGGPIKPLGRLSAEAEEETGGRMTSKSFHPYDLWQAPGRDVHADCWEFLSERGEVTIPSPSASVHMDIYNGANERMAGNFTAFNKVLLEPTASHICYLVIHQWKSTVFPEPLLPLPIEYGIVLTGTKVISAPGNLRPPEDPAHWALLSNA